MSYPEPKPLKLGNIAAGVSLLLVLGFVVTTPFWLITTPPVQADPEIQRLLRRRDELAAEEAALRKQLDDLIKSTESQEQPQEQPQEPQESPEASQGDLSTSDVPTLAPAVPALPLPPPDAIKVQVEVIVKEPVQPAAQPTCQNRCYRPQKSPKVLQGDLSDLDSSMLAPATQPPPGRTEVIIKESAQPAPCQNRCNPRRRWFR